ncbi:MAG: 50S ribosomal protein L25 [Terriglobales bacterium]
MAISLALAAKTRDGRGKGPARQLRRSGLIPATLYGERQQPLSLSVDPKEIGRILHSESGHNSIFNLAVDGGQSTAAMVVDWQREPLKGRLLHVDFKRIAMDQAIRVRVPIHTLGEAEGVKVQGGILEVVTREVEIECLPSDIPEQVTVDVTSLTIGQNIRVADLQVGAGRRVLTEPDRVVVHVVAVKEEVVAAPVEAEAAPTEPEVAKKGKEKTGEEAPAGEKGAEKATEKGADAKKEKK